MSPGAGANRNQAAAAASGADLAAQYRESRARLMRPPNAGPRTSWLPALIAFNEDMRRLFLHPTAGETIPPGERIRDIVAAQYGLTRVELAGGASGRRVSWPRQVAMYICARHAGLRPRTIATLFGGRDPSTVRLAVRTVEARQARNPALAADIAALVAKCRGSA